MSIKKTLRTTLMIFSIVPLIVVALLANHLIFDKLKTMKRENLSQVATTNANSLKALFDSQINELNLLANQNIISNLINYSNLDFNKSSSVYIDTKLKVQSILNQRRNLYSSTKSISLFNEDHVLIANSNDNNIITGDYTRTSLDYMDRTHLPALGYSGIFTSTQNGKTTNCIEIGTPIMGTNDSIIRGYVIVTFDLSYFDHFLNGIKIGKTGACFILNSDNKVVYDTNVKKIGTTCTYDSDISIVKNYNSNIIEETGTFIKKTNNVQNIYAYTVMPSLNWVLLVSQNVSEIKELSNIIIIILVWSLLLLILIVSITSTKFTRYFTNPILNLRDAMTAASDGDLDVQCTYKSQNELGELSTSFNKMMQIIKTNYNELNSMHTKLLSNEKELHSNYKHIEYLAYHDVLTGLQNKLSFYNLVNETLSCEPGVSSKHAIYFVDLDNFKTINDTLGHDYGDELLVQTSEKLKEMLCANDTLARAGGDEFLIFNSFIESEKSAIDFASKILDVFKEPFDLNGEIVYISMSIGISIYPKNGIDHNALIKTADIAMYKSKDTGKNKLTLFDESMAAELNRNTEILEVLRHAREKNEVYLMYQPQIEINSGKIIGYEALMRIKSETLGELSPEEFIPIAEESGLIIELGEWALKEACDFNKSLLDLGYDIGTVAVNISSIQLNRAGFVPMLKQVLKETKLPPNYLELEITESTLVTSIIDTASLLNDFQKMGVRLSLDDFGTGYSSLNYLTRIPINTLKIDKSFVDNICTNTKDSFIAETIIRLAHKLNIKVVAEGVEDTSQYSLLKTNFCDIIQGYLLSRPLLPDALELRLKNTINNKGKAF